MKGVDTYTRNLADLIGKEVNVTGKAINIAKYNKRNRYVLVKNVVVSFQDLCRKIDHIWIDDKLVISKKVNFNGTVSIYQRKDGTYDYGFSNQVSLIS